MSRRGSRLALLCVGLVAAMFVLGGCGKRGGTTDLHGTWRAVLLVPGGDLPFGLEIGREHGKDVAWLLNGPERAKVTDVSIDDDQVSMGMPGYPHRLEAKLEDGKLVGDVDFLRPGGKHVKTRLVAERGITWRFFPASLPSNADFSGRWLLTFTDPDSGDKSTGIAELGQRGHVVTGTVLRDSGDDRYIAGEARGDTVYLSRFDGGSAYLYIARLGADGKLEGEFRTGTGGFRQLSGYRDPNAQLADATTLTALKPDEDKLDFSFPDAAGRRVSLSDPRFQGKVVIVTIGGTWCPNCHDEAAFLQQFLKGRQQRGLEVVQLMFEYTSDFATSAASVRDFSKRFGIDYPVLIAGSYGPGEVQKAIPQLQKFYAYPTMLVLDRSGRVRYTHAGFSGPATGAHYQEFTDEFSKLIDGLLAEGPGKPGAA